MAKTRKRRVIQQVGVIAVREQSDGMAVCLITNHRGRWGFPKGNSRRSEPDDQAALREAYEEAGLLGEIVSPKKVAKYVYQKAKRRHSVAVYLMHVSETDDLWPESAERSRTWATLREARRLVARAGVLEVIERAMSQAEQIIQRTAVNA